LTQFSPHPFRLNPKVPNQLVGAPLGTDVQIECHVEASPKSINYWIKDTGWCVISWLIIAFIIISLLTGEMIVSSSKYIVQEHSRSLYEMKMSVTVKKFEKEDVGSYRCIAKNSLGEVDSSIRLYGEFWCPRCNRICLMRKIETESILNVRRNSWTDQKGSAAQTQQPKRYERDLEQNQQESTEPGQGVASAVGEEQLPESRLRRLLD